MFSFKRIISQLKHTRTFSSTATNSSNVISYVYFGFVVPTTFIALDAHHNVCNKIIKQIELGNIERITINLDDPHLTIPKTIAFLSCVYSSIFLNACCISFPHVFLIFGLTGLIDGCLGTFIGIEHAHKNAMIVLNRKIYIEK